MPQLTTAQTYNAAIPSTSSHRDVDFWGKPHFSPRPVANRKSSSARPRRKYRDYLWGIAASLKIFGILGTFVIAIHAGWVGMAAVAATLAGVSLRYVLEA